jgi:hypothetical protein
VTATVNVVPGPDYAVSAATLPTSGAPGAAFVGSPSLDFTVQETGGNAGTQSISWNVYISTDTLLDAGDTLEDSGSIGPLGASGSQLISFTGTWPGSPGKYYYLLVDLNAGDDSNPINNGYISGAIPVPDSFAESEPNDSAPPMSVSFDHIGTLAAGQLVQITGSMDTFGGYDTFRFTAGAGMTKIELRATWSTGFNDIDLFFWEEGGAVLASSQDPDADFEPKDPTLMKVQSLTPGQNYLIGVYFWLDNDTSGSAGQPYTIMLEGS